MSGVFLTNSPGVRSKSGVHVHAQTSPKFGKSPRLSNATINLAETFPQRKTNAAGPPSQIQKRSSACTISTVPGGQHVWKSPSSTRCRNYQMQSPKCTKDITNTMHAVSCALQAVSEALAANDGNHSPRPTRSTSSLANARALHKERVHAIERSISFTHNLLGKLDELRDDVVDSVASCSTSCGTASPRAEPCI